MQARRDLTQQNIMAVRESVAKIPKNFICQESGITIEPTLKKDLHLHTYEIQLDQLDH